MKILYPLNANELLIFCSQSTEEGKNNIVVWGFDIKKEISKEKRKNLDPFIEFVKVDH